MTWIVKGFNAIMFLLSSMIYLLINWLYQVFGAVANVNLFSEEVFDELTGRIYLIMGIAMLFIFAYNLVLMIINPDDKKGTGAMGKVVKETIISLTAVVLLPTIFGYMYTFQSHVISSNILGQLILGGAGTTTQDKSLCSDGDYECLCDFGFLGSNATEVETECDKYSNLSSSERGARIVPVTIFSAFYRPANFSFDECANHLANGDNSVIDASGDEHDICVNYFIGYQKAKYSGIITHLGDQPDLRDAIYDDPKLMEFDSFFAVIAGALGAWMFLCYAMEIGVRIFKLGVLQLISPIPVMMRIVPGQKEKMYDKWFKELLNTYLDVFIRLIIIYFALFAISLVPEMLSTLWSSFLSGDSNPIIKLLAMVVIILGILKFAQEAPELIKTFFGNSGRFALRSPSKQIADNKALQGGISRAKGIAGGVSALATTKANQFKHLKENWNRDDATFGSRYRQIRDLASNKAFKQGYNSTKDAKTLEDWGYNVKKSAVDTLKDKGFIYNARHTLGDLSDDLSNISNKNYFGQDTRGLQAKADAMELIAKEAKLIISKIEDDAKFKGVVGAFDSAIEAANNSGRADLVDKITDAKIKALADMRNSLLIEKLQGREAKVKYEVDTEGVTKAIVSNLDEVTKGINRELTTAVDNLNSSLSDNFERFSSEIKDSNIELGVKFGDSMSENLETLQKGIEGGNAKLVKNIKTVSEDIVASAKAEIINMEKKDAKK